LSDLHGFHAGEDRICNDPSPAVSRRAYRQPVAAGEAVARKRAARGRTARSGRAHGDRERGHPPRGQAAGRGGTRGHHRRRVPARHLFGRLHQLRPVRRRRRADRAGGLDAVGNPRPPHGAAHPQDRRPHRMEGAAQRRRFSVLEVADAPDAEIHAARALLHQHTVPGAATSAPTSIRASTSSGRT
jgi:hypothetical protein